MRDGEELVHRYFGAMRRGAAGEAAMRDVLHPAVVYVEPFSGLGTPAIGREATLDRLRAGWAEPLPEMELDVLTVEVVGETARSTWECRSPALPGPVRGEDRYRFADGRIVSLEVVIDPPSVEG